MVQQFVESGATGFDRFSAATQNWFSSAFKEPTEAQLHAWAAIQSGQNTLVIAPTGSGKTLAAFLWALDRLARPPKQEEAPASSGVKVLYISPLKALGVDVERNLRGPLIGLREASRSLGLAVPDVSVAVRSGDTTASERRQILAHPPDILITTPESLYLLLTSKGREILKSVDTVIVDEVHALAGNKRGAHLAVSLERLDSLLTRPAQRIGLSATVEPASEVARFLGGDRPVQIVRPPSTKKFDITVEVPVEDMANPPTEQREMVNANSNLTEHRLGSMWPSIEQSLYQRIMAARSTIVFTNSRRQAERLTARLNQIHEAEVEANNAPGTPEGNSGIPEEDFASPAGNSGTPKDVFGSPEAESGTTKDVFETAETIAEAAGSVPADGVEPEGGAASADRAVRTDGAASAEVTALPDGVAPADGAARPAGSPLPANQSPTLARAHHGSVSKEQRKLVEEELKSGILRCVVATASLELGIDMGEVDLVVQIDPPPSVSSGLQRLGRSGHQVGGASTAVFYPTHRSKLLETAVIAERMQAGQIETLRVLSNPLDVLAQQTVAAAVECPLEVDRWFDSVRRSAPFANLPRSAFVSVLDLISGKYPSTEFASLRARVDWDRNANTLTARPGAQRLAVTNGGTIPDRGLYRVVTGSAENGPGTRVGELDEEMVYETRVGEVFALGTTPWRVRRITKDTVEVEPAFGVVAKTPFWHGDSPARPVELGRALGELTAFVGAADQDEAAERLTKVGFGEYAVQNTISYVREQLEESGYLPTNTQLLVEKTRDDVGDWQYILHSPLGLTVHSPWALAINARLRDKWGLDSKATPSNDGIIVRVPDFDEEGSPQSGEGGPLQSAEIFLFEPGEIEEVVRAEVENSAVFAARFREAAARALILGGSKPGKRSPLWQQRLRATSLLEVASKYSDFPMILEALREVLQDVYDVDSLTTLMSGLATRRVSLVEVETQTPSPFARSQLFGYVGEFIYSGDTPLGERRIAALSVDPSVLRELLGEVPLKDLLESDAVVEVVSELQRTKPGWHARGADGLVDLLRALGPLTRQEIKERLSSPEGGTCDSVVSSCLDSRQLVEVRMAGREYLAAAEDAGLLVSAVGIATPAGVPEAFLTPPLDALSQLVSRHLNASGPLMVQQLAARFGISEPSLLGALRRLEDSGDVVTGQFLPSELADSWGISDSDPQWVAKQVLDRLRSRSLALLRGSVEPVRPTVFAQFIADWQGCGGARRGVDGVFEVATQLSNLPVPASALETLVLPQRVGNYEPTFLDQLISSGEVRWIGHGSIGSHDGWVYLVPAGESTLVPLGANAERTELEEAVLGVLRTRGALFMPALQEAITASGLAFTTPALRDAIWSLAWDGLITSDSLTALRARISGRRSAQKTPSRRPRGRSLTRRSLTGLGVSARADSSAVEPTLAGRWSLVQDGEGTGEGTELSQASLTLRAVQLLERYGIVTRGSVAAEDFPGGFAQAYRLYSDFESSGVCRRGYFVEGLGGAQFAVPGAVDRLRSLDEQSRQSSEGPHALTLSASDPANPYGAALEWPEVDGTALPKRNAGALITLVDGLAAFYLERGGKTALAFDGFDPDQRRAAVGSLVKTCRRGDLATFTIEKVNGSPVRESPWAESLAQGGFSEVPRGYTLRRKIR